MPLKSLKQIISDIFKKEPIITLKSSICSAAELNFYNHLKQAVAQNYTITHKLKIADLIDYDTSYHDHKKVWDDSNSRHLDFVLLDPKTLQPQIAIELDDASHNEPQHGDGIKNRICIYVGLPLLRIRCRPVYDIQKLTMAIAQTKAKILKKAIHRL